MDAAQPAAEPAAEAAPPLRPREELFCRAAARGDTLAAAARAAGYAPGSARQRGCELWARDAIQARIGVLIAEREAKVETEVAELRTLTQSLFEHSCRTDRIGHAVRLLTFRYRLHQDAQAARAPVRAERERMRAELRDELEAEVRMELAVALEGPVASELRARLEKRVAAELRADLMAQVRSDLRREMAPAVRVELRRELRAGIAAEFRRAGPDRSVTKQDAGEDFPRPAAAAAPATSSQPAEPSVTNQDAGADFSRPALDAAPAVPPQPAERSVTKQDAGRVFSPPAASAAAGPDHDDPEAFEAILRAVHARPLGRPPLARLDGPVLRMDVLSRGRAAASLPPDAT